MKFFPVLLAILFANCCMAQTIEENEIEVKLFLPTHVKNELKPTDKLEVYFITFPSDSAKKIPLKVIGKKLKENTYSFKMPQLRFWQVGFKIGVYGDYMLCVNNKDGEGQGNHDFNLHLVKYQPDFAKPRFLPPCIMRDDEEE
jgi:hypothetical protein